MTPDEAREIAIAVLRERAGVLGHPFEEAAAVLEALGPLGSIALPGVAPRTQGEPQANVEPRGCLCGGPMKCVRCGEEWFMPGQMQKTMDEAQANVEEKKAAFLEDAMEFCLLHFSATGYTATSVAMVNMADKLRESFHALVASYAGEDLGPHSGPVHQHLHPKARGARQQEGGRRDVSEELKPCPFCGGLAGVIQQGTGKLAGERRHRVNEDAAINEDVIETLAAKLAAREKRMREVAAKLLRLAEDCEDSARRRDLEGNGGQAAAWRGAAADARNESAKLLEGLPGFESAISEEED